MFYEERIGKPLLEFKLGLKERVLKIICYTMAAVFIAAAILLFLEPELFDFDLAYQPHVIERWVYIVLYILGAFSVVGGIKFLRGINSAVIHEKGIMIYQGAEIHELLYSEIKGALPLSFTQILVSSGPSAQIAFPGKQRRRITIVKKDDGLPIIFSVPRFSAFVRAFNNAFTRHTVAGLSRDNVHKANISFGEHLWLEDGNFVFQHCWASEKIILPFADVRGIEMNKGFSVLCIKGQNKQILIPQKMARSLLNIDILYYIIAKL